MEIECSCGWKGQPFMMNGTLVNLHNCTAKLAERIKDLEMRMIALELSAATEPVCKECGASTDNGRAGTYCPNCD